MKHVESALEGAYASLPGETLFEEGVFHQRPRSTCHAEAEQRLCSQMDQMEGIKTGDPLSSFFPIRSSARFLRSEARFSPPPQRKASTEVGPPPNTKPRQNSLNRLCSVCAGFCCKKNSLCCFVFLDIKIICIGHSEVTQPPHILQIHPK